MNKVTYTDFLGQFGVGGAHPGSLTATQKVLEHCNITNKTNVLDLGCGTGQTAAWIAKKYGCPVTGVDSSELMLQKASKRIETEQLPIQLVAADATQLPFENDRFDLVLAESVLSFTPISKTLAEIARVLRPNGLFSAIEMTKIADLTEAEIREMTSFYGVSTILSETAWIDKLTMAQFTRVTAKDLPTVYESNAVEFHFSPSIDPTCYDIMEEHERLLKKYHHKIGAKVYQCTI